MRSRGLALALLCLHLIAATPEALELETLAGERVTISLRSPERPLILHFWATWCPSCVEEMPALERSVRERCGERVRVLAVNVEEKPAAIRDFAKTNGLSLELLRDPEGRGFKSAVGGRLPANLIATRDGSRTLSGPRSPSQWKSLLSELGCAE